MFAALLCLTSDLCPLTSQAASPLPATGFWNVTQVTILSGTTASLTWTAPGYDVSSYKLYDIATGAKVLLGTATTASTQLTGLTSGYHLIAVSAVRSADSTESALAAPVILVNL